jgi:Dynamin family
MDVASVVGWWGCARGFFGEHAPATLTQLDNEAIRLKRLLEHDEQTVVCVLGQAAVGKSTLLNAIVAGSDIVLPAGGIGPLTAIATRVCYSKEPYFRVRYQDSKQLQGVRLALEAELRRQGHIDGPLTAEDDPEVAGVNSLLAVFETEEPDVLSAETSAPVAPDSEGPEHNRAVDSERRKRIEELLTQVRQVVKGDQFANADIAELVAGFRLVLGYATPGLPALSPEDGQRVKRAAATLSTGKGGAWVCHSKSDLGRDFIRSLREHAGGALAPLIAEIEVGWPSEVLKDGLVLVDLPGVGIASDRHRAVTSEFMRRRARAVILVVDRAGPTDASVNLIRESGYWDRLLLSSEDPESDRCALLLAVSKIDDLAIEEHRQTDYLPREERPKLRDVFLRLRTEVEERIGRQAALSFGKLSHEPTDDEVVRTARTEAGQTLLASLKVFPVSAIQYRELVAEEQEISVFLRHPEDTGIPQLQSYLRELAAGQRGTLLNARQEVASRLLRTASTTLDQTHAQWSANLRAAEEAARLREELDRFLEPKRTEIANREGAFREFLEATATTRIDELVAKAQLAAQQEVSRYLGDLSNLHWATLRATVTRGGAFVSGIGRRVDLAADIAQRFQEPMAAVWGQTLLKEVRNRTRQHGETLEKIVKEVCDWANTRSDTMVQRQVLSAQQGLIRDRVRQLGQVGKEAVDELKNAVKHEMIEQIAGPVRKACEEFVRRGDGFGPGVKRRILDLFGDLSSRAVTSTARPASRLLKARFAEVQFEIISALADWGDPIQQAADAVAEREETRVRRSDAQRRAAVLGELQSLRDGMPPCVSARAA